MSSEPITAAVGASSGDFKRWTKDDEDRLDQAVATYGAGNWTEIAQYVGGRTPRAVHKHFAQKQAKIAARALEGGGASNIRTGAWSKDEEERLDAAFAKYGNNWDEVAREIGGGRTPHGVQLHHAVKQRCLAARIGSSVAMKTGHWTTEEDAKLEEAYQKFGTNWVEVARAVGGRTPEAVRMRLHGKQQRLAAMADADAVINTGAWTNEEESRFDEAYKLYGNKWVLVAKHVKSRTPKSVMAHYSRLQQKTTTAAAAAPPPLASSSGDKSADDDAELSSLPSSVGSFIASTIVQQPTTTSSRKRRRVDSELSDASSSFGTGGGGDCSPRIKRSLRAGLNKEEAKEVSPSIFVSGFSLDVLASAAFSKVQQPRADSPSAHSVASHGSWQYCSSPVLNRVKSTPSVVATPPLKKIDSRLNLLVEAALGRQQLV